MDRKRRHSEFSDISGLAGAEVTGSAGTRRGSATETEDSAWGTQTAFRLAEPGRVALEVRKGRTCLIDNLLHASLI